MIGIYSLVKQTGNRGIGPTSVQSDHCAGVANHQRVADPISKDTFNDDASQPAWTRKLLFSTARVSLKCGLESYARSKKPGNAIE
jgi:hypothetical protein